MKILIAGEGGQGIQVIAEILAKAVFMENKSVLYIPNFGVEQRGGVSLAFLVVEQKPVVYPKFLKADILALFSERSRKRVKDHLDKKTRLILGPGLKGGLKTDLPTRAWNILVLGKINRLAKIVQSQTLIRAMEERFSQQYLKHPELREINRKALNQ
jgi:2-oxoglutarate ferredoxin oxidoreductase subunit gamma